MYNLKSELQSGIDGLASSKLSTNVVKVSKESRTRNHDTFQPPVFVFPKDNQTASQSNISVQRISTTGASKSGLLFFKSQPIQPVEWPTETLFERGNIYHLIFRNAYGSFVAVGTSNLQYMLVYVEGLAKHRVTAMRLE